MPECQCVYVVVQDPSLVICTSHKGLGLLLRADIEGLVVYTLEGAFDDCVFFLFCLKNMLVQIDVHHTHSLTIDYHISWNTLCCVLYYLLLINQTIHLESESHELGNAMSVVLVFEDSTR